MFRRLDTVKGGMLKQGCLREAFERQENRESF
jgi:hypothetical protein